VRVLYRYTLSTCARRFTWYSALCSPCVRAAYWLFGATRASAGDPSRVRSEKKFAYETWRTVRRASVPTLRRVVTTAGGYISANTSVLRS